MKKNMKRRNYHWWKKYWLFRWLKLSIKFHSKINTNIIKGAVLNFVVLFMFKKYLIHLPLSLSTNQQMTLPLTWANVNQIKRFFPPNLFNLQKMLFIPEFTQNLKSCQNNLKISFLLHILLTNSLNKSYLFIDFKLKQKICRNQ